ncbi:MAG: winged helix-turn-helix domain-containing protein [Micrococcales bacterium]
MAQVAQISNYRTNPDAAPAAPTPAPAPKRTLTAVANETEARGFALYLGVDEATARAAGTSLTEIAAALKRTFAELVPQAADQTYASVALAPKHAKGRNLDIVRTALQDPRALANLVEATTDDGLTIDLARKRIYLNGEITDATNKEFELLAFLVENQQRIVSRQEIVDAIWHGDDSDAPNERTIDVHVRRLRSKIAGFEDVVRTIRGVGYQYNANPDVVIAA